MMTLEKLEGLDKERKESIINAALREFAIKGYDEASTISIAKNAGISKGLLFHYVNTKKDLFLYLYDYSLRIILEDFFGSINMQEKDMLERCRQIAFVKLELLHRHPQLFHFFQTAIFTESVEVKAFLDNTSRKLRKNTFDKLFEEIDESKFKSGLDVAMAKELIVWSLNGIADKIQQKVKGLTWDEIDYDTLIAECDSYFEILKRLFYKSEED